MNKTIDELEAELDRLGRPIGGDSGVNELFLNLYERSLVMFILPLCR